MNKIFFICVSIVCIYSTNIYANNSDSDELFIFSKKIKSIRVNEDSKDDVLKKIGSPTSFDGEIKMHGLTLWSYMPVFGVKGYVQFDQSGIVSGVRVFNGLDGGLDEIYSKGEVEIPGISSPSTSQKQSDHFPLKESAPENPTEGQIYFNKTDKHFYGWDGTAWLKLDAKP